MKAHSLVLSLLLTFVLAGFAFADGKEKKPDGDTKPIKKPDGGDAKKQGQDAAAFFKTHDRNGDGMLSLAEFTGGKGDAMQGTAVKKPNPNQPGAKKPNAKKPNAKKPGAKKPGAKKAGKKSGAKKAAKKRGAKKAKKPGAKKQAKKPGAKKQAKKPGAKKQAKQAAKRGAKKPAKGVEKAQANLKKAIEKKAAGKGEGQKKPASVQK